MLGGLDVEVWLTRPDRSALCAKQPGYLPVDTSAPNRATIKVNPARTHQIMEGFGFALTGGSADFIAQLAAPTRNALLRELFLAGNGGMGMSCLRISIGASDLSSATFSYDDLPAGEIDPGLDRFDLEAGDVALIPMLKAILGVNPDVRIIAAPWSAPPCSRSEDPPPWRNSSSRAGRHGGIDHTDRGGNARGYYRPRTIDRAAISIRSSGPTAD
jgi:glucosylceramidase